MSLLNIGTNKKLGPVVASWSRPVGPTCPHDCPFLTGVMPDGTSIPPKHKCYAKKIGERYTNVSTNWKQSLRTDYTSWIEDMFREISCAPVKAIRIHVAGDFADNNKPDHTYISAVIELFELLRDAGIDTPAWFYTHIWEGMTRYLETFKRLGIECFASVHTTNAMAEAKRAGWRLALDPGEMDAKKVIKPLFGSPAIGCPEQIGTKKDCGTCGFCFNPAKGVQDVVFFRHS